MRGQASASGAAATVILTGLVILLYILFLPPAERDAILEGTVPSPHVPPDVIDPHDVLLEVHPRRIDALDQRVFTFDLNPFLLTSVGEDASIARFGAAHIFSSKTDKRVFYREAVLAKDYAYTNPFLVITLSSAEQVRGRMKVYFNERLVYHARPERGSTIIIEDLGKVERTNTIRIEMEEPGFWQFFTRNEASISSVELFSQVARQELQRAEQHFTLSAEQQANLETARLSFIPECEGRTEVLIIRVNERLISSGALECSSLVRLDLPPEYLERGRNAISFALSKGTVHVSAPSVRVTLEEPTRPVHYFEVSAAQYADLAERKVGILHFEFVRTDERVVMDVFVNGRSLRVDTRDRSFRQDISDMLVEGENYIRLDPVRSVDIARMSIFLRAAS